MQEPSSTVSLKKALVLAVAGAGLLALSLPGWNLWPLAFFALAPWAWASTRVDRRAWMVDAAFLLSFLTFSVWWIGHVSIVGAGAAILVMAALMLPLGWLYRRLVVCMPATLALPIAWCAIEFLRTRYPYGGLPFSQLGLALWEMPEWIRIANLAGIHAVSFVIAAASGVLVDLLEARTESSKRRVILGAVIAAVLILGSAGYSLLTLPIKSPPQKLPVLAVQANIPTDSKSEGLSAKEIFGRNLQLTNRGMQQYPDTALLLWPESAFLFPLADGVRDEAAVIIPGDPPFTGKSAKENEKALSEQVFRKLLKGKDTALLAGAVLYLPGDPVWSPHNSALLLLPPDGRRSGIYHKMHLVPGGEFAPNLGPISMFVEWLSGLEGFRGEVGALEAGEKVEIVTMPWKGEEIRIGVSICYDNAYADVYREATRLGARFHVVLSNEGWYGNSSEMDQLLAASVFRAIETGRPVIRATLSGISAHIDALGHVVGVVEGPHGERKHVEGLLRAEVDLGAAHPTGYLSWGDLPLWGLCGLALILALRPRKCGKLPAG